MSTTKTTGNACGKAFNLSRTALARLMHDYSHIKTMTHAQLFRTGELDVKLLKLAQLSVEPALERQPIVAVEASAIVFNCTTRRDEPVFAVRSCDGAFQGHYFAAAFKSLTL